MLCYVNFVLITVIIIIIFHVFVHYNAKLSALTDSMSNRTRKPCCRKETAQCRGYSFSV